MNQFFLNGYILQHIRNQMLFYSIINICIFNKIVFFIVIFLKSAECINNLIICSNLQSNIIGKPKCIVNLSGDS